LILPVADAVKDVLLGLTQGHGTAPIHRNIVEFLADERQMRVRTAAQGTRN
jgi:hypothetical protein